MGLYFGEVDGNGTYLSLTSRLTTVEPDCNIAELVPIFVEIITMSLQCGDIFHLFKFDN